MGLGDNNDGDFCSDIAVKLVFSGVVTVRVLKGGAIMLIKWSNPLRLCRVAER